MQNRSALWIFTVLLALACLYQISFTFVTNSVESDAEEEAVRLASFYEDSVRNIAGREPSATELDAIKTHYADSLLKLQNSEEVYPLIGYTYKECKDRELVQGLDLKGGMSVILEVRIPELIRTFAANKANDPTFSKVLDEAINRQLDDDREFMAIFEETWNELAGDEQISAIFLNREYKGRFLKEDDGETRESLTNEVMFDKLEAEAQAAITSTEKILRARIDKFGTTQPNIQRQGFTGRIVIELPGVKDKARVRKILQSTANLEFWETYDNVEVAQFLGDLNNYWANAMYPGLDSIIAARSDSSLTDSLLAQDVDTLGQPIDTVPGDDTVTGDEPSDLEAMFGDDSPTADPIEGDVESGDGIDDQELVRMANPLWSRMIFPQDENGQPEKGCRVGIANVKDTAMVKKLLFSEEVRGYLPSDVKLLWGNKATDDGWLSLYAIRRDRPGSDKPPLDGTAITDARQDFGQLGGEIVVNMEMDGPGSRTWGEITGRNIQRAVAVVLDDLVYSAPIVQGAITTGNTQITMGGGKDNETLLEAQDLANILKAGSLPAPARIVDEAVVGPTLGAENIRTGIISFIVALCLVLAYMIFYYAKAGVIANVALLANVFFLVGALASMQAALTLPGIAGIVLTIGMSVDANVLIFERIREEMRAGKGMRLAITDGYKRALAAIIDANLTTFLTALVLFLFGTGPIKGFATTLMIGIFTSLFSAIFITRLIFMWQLERKKPISFATKLTANAFTKLNIGFIRKRKLYYAISGLVIIAGIASLTTRGLNLGVEFTGGRSYVIEFNQAADREAVESALNDGLVYADASGREVSNQVKRIDQVTKLKVVTNFRSDDKSAEAANDIEVQVLDLVHSVDPSGEVLESRAVAGTISDDIRASANLAVIFSLLVIFLYILFRFRKWQYGLGALLAMVHDVLIVLSLFSLFYGILPFSMEVDQAFIAAILTVVGYSINDTVVVFDRIREYLGLYRKKEEKEVVNMALNSTLSRTINTSVSTFVVLLIIFILGGEAIKGFTFALMVGVVVGTYSSLCIATPTAVDFSRRLGRKEE